MGKSWGGDIGLDDILLTEGACPAPGKSSIYCRYLTLVDSAYITVFSLTLLHCLNVC